MATASNIVRKPAVSPPGKDTFHFSGFSTVVERNPTTMVTPRMFAMVDRVFASMLISSFTIGVKSSQGFKLC